MYKKLILFFIFLTGFSIAFTQDHGPVIQSIYHEALKNGECYENLRFLSKEIGHRLSGSTGAAAAVEYTRQLMEQYGFDTVFLQPVMVPHWVRGNKEQARIVRSATMANREMNCVALGNSVGTGPEGLVGSVIEVQTLDEVVQLGPSKVRGKIVFFNRPLDPTKINTFAAYGGAYDQRGHGHRVAAENGAIGVIVRSLASQVDHYPHAGTISIREGDQTVPAIAISTSDADMLSRELKKDPALTVYLETNCSLLDEVLSYNVIGQINGYDSNPDYIAVGGHLDSWDLGEGAHDDGAGCIQAIEALRILKSLKIKPRNNIRAVMWMNEENGLRGGRKYAEVARDKEENHIAAIESDRGGFVPTGFTFQTEDKRTWEKIREWEPLFKPYNLYDFKQGGGGVDISPLKDNGTLLIGLQVDAQRYFNLHHSAADVFEEVDKRELELGAASLAGLIYLIDKEGI
jgi:hypothetical protein